MEQTSSNTECQGRLLKLVKQEVVNHIDSTTNSEHNVQVNHEEVNHIDNTSNSENNVQVNHEEARQSKTRTKAKPKSKPKPQHATDAKLTTAEMI